MWVGEAQGKRKSAPPPPPTPELDVAYCWVHRNQTIEIKKSSSEPLPTPPRFLAQGQQSETFYFDQNWCDQACSHSSTYIRLGATGTINGTPRPFRSPGSAACCTCKLPAVKSARRQAIDHGGGHRIRACSLQQTSPPPQLSRRLFAPHTEDRLRRCLFICLLFIFFFCEFRILCVTLTFHLTARIKNRYEAPRHQKECGLKKLGTSIMTDSSRIFEIRRRHCPSTKLKT